MTPPIAVAVVSWNTRDELSNCLESLQPDHDAGLAEVFVVDNCSTDGSRELVRERFGWARLIEAPANIGYGPAVNLAAASLPLSMDRAGQQRPRVHAGRVDGAPGCRAASPAGGRLRAATGAP